MAGQWRWLGVVVVALALALAWVGLAPSRAQAQPTPDRVNVLALEPDTAATALLRWQPVAGLSYRLCTSTGWRQSGLVFCDEVGDSGAWPVAPPLADGGVLYLTLQACQGEVCSEPAQAGVLTRRLGDMTGFYATALLLPNGRARLGGFVNQGPATLRFHRATPATVAAEMACPALVDDACLDGDVPLTGGRVGVSATWSGGRRLEATIQLREPPTIAFMFDDGTGIVSGGKYLMQSILDEYGVKGSFFLTGRAMQTYPGAVRALVAAGHRVGNHTWSHPYLTRLGDAAIQQELDLTENQYRSIIPGGTLRPCFRASNGDFNARVLSVLGQRGYRQYTQNVSSLDYLGISSARIVANVLGEARDGAVVSFHSQEPQTAIALRTLIPTLLAQGYQFVLAC